MESVESIENMRLELVRKGSQLATAGIVNQTLMSDLESLKRVVSEKNAKLTRLEAENIRLKLQRTDVQLGDEVAGLRKTVGSRDRELIELRKRIEKSDENEKTLLMRTSSAEQKVVVLQNTLTTMQAARDAAERREREVRSSVEERVEEQNQLRVEAVRKMVEAVSRREALDKKVLGLLEIISAVGRVLPLLPDGLAKNRDVRNLLELLKKNAGS